MVSVDRNSPGRFRFSAMRVRSLHLHSQECQRRTHIHRSLRRRSHHCWGQRGRYRHDQTAPQRTVRYEGPRDCNKVSRHGNRIWERWIDQNTSKSVHSTTSRASRTEGLQLRYHSARYVGKTLIDHERRSPSRRQRVRQHSGRINVRGMCNKARHNVRGRPIISISSSKHMSTAKLVLRYLQGTSNLGIMYRPPPLRLQGYSDADSAGDIDTRRSTTGYVVMLNNGAIAWKSRCQPTVALSTMELEYMALTEATKELKWIRTLLAELGYSNGNTNVPTDLFSDNQSAIALAKNPVAHACAKHIDLHHHFVREAIQDKIIWVQYIPTTEMTADSLTKALGHEKHESALLAWG